MANKIAIIGAGCSGLTAIKCCLDEGLEPICFEKSHEIGGLWRFERGEKDGATVYSTTVINSSKETLAYSDFPIPEEYPNFMHHTKIMEYFNQYADRFNLRKCIHFHSELLSCCPTEDFDTTGKWRLTIKNNKIEATESFVFDGVMICIGHHAEPYYPIDEFPGQEKFTGIKMHSRSYREPWPFTDKRVTVIGTGNSGCDIAVELSRNAKKVFQSTRRGTWVFNRITETGIPYDLIAVTRLKSWLINNIPSLMNPLFESVLNGRFDHEKYGLKPKHRVLSQHPTINDELPNRIVNGTIEIKPNIKRFTEHGVVFDDGSDEEMDVVIFATGFSFLFPFLDKKILHANKHESNLFHLVWPMNLKRNTLAVIGLVQPQSVIGPCSELQARWAARVFKGACKLPSREEMKQKYDEMMAAMKNRYLGSYRHTIEVDGVEYMDGIAEELGCKPNLWKMAIVDPFLAWEVFKGPFTCVQYRLSGPGEWKDARKTIMTQWDRVWCPLSKKKIGGGGSSNFTNILLIAAVFFVVALLLKLVL